MRRQSCISMPAGFSVAGTVTRAPWVAHSRKNASPASPTLR